MQKELLIETLHNELGELNSLISAYDTEIEYLEELLTLTSGPAEEVIENLKEATDRRNYLRTVYSNTFKELETVRSQK